MKLAVVNNYPLRYFLSFTGEVRMEGKEGKRIGSERAVVEDASLIILSRITNL